MRLAANNAQNAECDTLMQIPFFDRGGDDKSAEVEKNNPVHILSGNIRINNVEITQSNPRW